MFGDIRLHPLPLPPRLIQDWCDPENPTSEAKHFRENIIAINTSFGFGSLSAGVQMPPGVGPPVVMMNGQQSQQIGNLLPPIIDEQGTRRDPLFAQAYILDDSSTAADVRLRTAPAGGRLQRGVMCALERLMREHNPFAQRLATLGQQLARASSEEETGLPPPQHFRLSILDNRPAPGQVFALFDSRNNIPPDPNLTGIWITTEGRRLQRIDILNRNADWILFPLMFPYATQTYGKGILRRQPIGTESVPDDDEDLLEMINTGQEFPASSGDPMPAAPTGIYCVVNARLIHLRAFSDIAETSPDAPQDLNFSETSSIPVVEPSGWNDVLATSDVPIPVEAIGEVADSDEENEAEDGVEHEVRARDCPRRPHICNGLWHFTSEERPFVQYRVPLPPNYAPLQQGSIRQQTTLNWEEVAYLSRSDHEWLDDRLLYAYMARVAHGSTARVAVYDPRYTHDAREFRSAGEGELDFASHTYGELHRPEVIAIPIHLPGHWTLGIFDAGTNIVNYYDSLHYPLAEPTREDMLMAVMNFYPQGVLEDVAAPRINVVDPRAYNAQRGDSWNCGFHVALLWEHWLMTADHKTLIEPFSIAHERLRIQSNLISIFIGDEQPILPLPNRIFRVEPLEQYHRSLPHADLLDRLRQAMHNPVAVHEDAAPAQVTPLFLSYRVLFRCLSACSIHAWT
jgi:hypothetical protein